MKTDYFNKSFPSLRLESLAQKMNEQLFLNKKRNDMHNTKSKFIKDVRNFYKNFEAYEKSEEGNNMSDDKYNELKLAVDNFIVADSGYIHFDEKIGFNIQQENKDKRTKDAIRLFVNLRNQFVTARDLNEAENLVDIGFMKV